MVLLNGFLLGNARPYGEAQMPSLAPRFAVPVLCTDNQLAAHTKARGTAVIVDASGLILTAAHVILEAKLYCTLTVLVPNDEWSRASKFYAFTVQQCSADQLLDIATCRITPLDRLKDWSFLRAANLRMQGWTPNAFARITGFTGWGWFPTVLRGQILPPQLYHTHEGCYCDVAVNVETHEGMSGSPIVDEGGEVIGVITLAGTGRFRGVSFGTSMANAVGFLRKHGWSGVIGR
jgi:S1-C subfamily serine protease